jgi:hypothetical protein
VTSRYATAAGPAATEADGPILAPALSRYRLGADLRRLRQARSLRIEDVAARLGIAPSTLSRMETGHSQVKAAYLTVLLDLYRVRDQAQRDQLTDLAWDGMGKGWHDGYRSLDQIVAGFKKPGGWTARPTPSSSWTR